MPHIHLLDIIPLQDLQQVQDAFVDATHVSSAIVDMAGVPLTKPSNLSSFCALMFESPGTHADCVYSNRVLAEQACAANQPVQAMCRNLGMMHAAAPIILEGRHVATWMIGMGVRRRITDEEVLAFAASKGLPADKTLWAYKTIPVRNEDVSSAVKLLALFANHLSDVGYKNYRLQQADAEKGLAIAALRTVLSNVESLIYVNDPQTHRIVFANDALCRQLDEPDLVGRLCYEVLQGSPEPCFFCPHRHLFDARGNPRFAPYSWEFRNPKMNRDMHIVDRLITWHDGRLLHMEVATDIGDRKARALAEAANVAKRDFLARMSHELRTPMNGVLGMTHLALEADPPPQQREYLKKIQSSASLLLGIINDILDFSRIEAGKLECERRVFNLHESIETVRELIQPLTGDKDLRLTMLIDPEAPAEAVGDGLRFTQILMNLLGNAVKFTHEGGVTLRIRHIPLAGGRFRLDCAVEDTGIGISEEQMRHLFTPFAQADASITRKFGGTGLGLAISKALVELMGGSITVTSQPGAGSVFSFSVQFSLPDCAAAESQEAANPAAAQDLCKGKRLLVVEDNDLNQEIAIALLSGLGADVDLASNGEEGVAAFLRKDYDIIFMDIRMPVMDGYEAARRIRASSKYDATRVPIIAMTANAMREDKEASTAAGMNGHIAKPIIFEELARTIAFWLTHPELLAENSDQDIIFV